METRERILQTARQEFFSRGFSRVTMDEIAYRLGMSKRTLYQLFPGKKALLQEALLNKVGRIAAGLEEIINRDFPSFTDKLRAVLLFMAESLPRPSTFFLEDIQRSAPEIWREIDQRRGQVVCTHFGRLFEEGARLGHIRQELNPELMILMFTALIQRLISPEVMAQLPFSAGQLYQHITDVFFQGVLSSQGKEEYLKS